MSRYFRMLVTILGCAGLVVVGFGPARADVGGVRPGAESKFVQLDPIDYTLVVREEGEDPVSVAFKTTTSKIFYTFQPADQSPETAPLFIFLNGGPGAATTANFFANNTAPYTINLEAVGNNRDGVVKKSQQLDQYREPSVHRSFAERVLVQRL